MKKYLLYITSTLLIVTLCACSISETTTTQTNTDIETIKTPAIASGGRNTEDYPKDGEEDSILGQYITFNRDVEEIEGSNTNIISLSISMKSAYFRSANN